MNHPVFFNIRLPSKSQINVSHVVFIEYFKFNTAGTEFI